MHKQKFVLKEVPQTKNVRLPKNQWLMHSQKVQVDFSNLISAKTGFHISRTVDDLCQPKGKVTPKIDSFFGVRTFCECINGLEVVRKGDIPGGGKAVKVEGEKCG